MKAVKELIVRTDIDKRVRVILDGKPLELGNVMEMDIHLDVDSMYFDINSTERYVIAP